MNIIGVILNLLSAAVNLYTILCFVNIIMSWLPGVKFTKVGRFISSLCDPYMNFFSRWGFLRIGNVDFSPIISIGILSLVSSILGGINATGRIYLGQILATIIYMLWNICSSLLGIIFLLVLIRWIVLLVHHGHTDYNSPWNQVDMMLQKFCYRVANTFSRGNTNYQKALLISWITFLAILGIGNILIRILVNLCYSMPF